MWWGTTLWLSAALAVAASALHLATEDKLPTQELSPGPIILDDNTNEKLVNVISSEHEPTSKPDIINVSKRSGENIEPTVGDPDTDLDPDPGIDPGADPDPEPGTIPDPDQGTSPDPDPPEDDDDNTVVDTSSGKVRGFMWRDNKNIISYIDIQYGTFNNLFEAPEAPAAKADVHEQKEHSKRCPQLEGDKYVGDKDCLTLSIFKPSEATGASVLVHIHEGNFINQSADPNIYGPEYLISKGIILVLPNYRLGPLGFMCQQDEAVPGNAALKDLTLALKWVKDNIAKFGGNADNIAVSGDGTAGALAQYLALSPLSKANVKKVMTESGSVLSHWAIDRNPGVSAKALSDSIDDFDKWDDIDAETIVKAAKNIVFRPCLERNNTDDQGQFMVATPWMMIENGEIKIPFLIGSAKYAGVHESLNHTTESIHQLNDDANLLLPNDLKFTSSEEKITVGNRVKSQYFGQHIHICDMENRTLYYTDASYLGPGIRTARALVKSGATVYFYEFDFVGKLNRELEAVERPLDGAVRGDIIGYMFTQDGATPAQDTEEAQMVEELTTLLTNFVKTGTPTVEGIQWSKLEEVEAAEEQWLLIGAKTSLEKGLHVDRLSLWSEIYNQHFTDTSVAFIASPSVYTVLIMQTAFFITFFKNVWHFF